MTADQAVVGELVRGLPERVVEVVLRHVGGVGAHQVIAERVQVELVLLHDSVVEEEPLAWIVVVLAADQVRRRHGSAHGVGDLLPSECTAGEQRDGPFGGQGYGSGIGPDDVVATESGRLLDESVLAVADLLERIDVLERLVEDAFPAVARTLGPQEPRVVRESPRAV